MDCPGNPTKMKKADRIYYNPIGLYALNLMLCSVFALLPYEHKPYVYGLYGLEPFVGLEPTTC